MGYIVATLLLASAFFVSDEASAQWTTTKFSGALAGASCFPQVSYVAMDGKLRESSIQIDNTDNQRRMMITSVIDRIKFLSNNQRPLFADLNVNIHKGGRNGKCSSYTSSNSSIELVTECKDGDTPFNTATHFAHEMGHIVGLRGYYKSYQGSNPVCQISRYATNNDNDNRRNEEFAEVFATYLHAPNALRAKCQAQYEWIRRNVFRSGPDPAQTCTGNPIPEMNNPSYENFSDGENFAGNTGGVYGQAQGIAAIAEQLLNQSLQKWSTQTTEEPAPPYSPYRNLYNPEAEAIREDNQPVNPWPGSGN